MNARVTGILHSLLFALALNTVSVTAFASSDSVQQRWDFRVLLDDTPIGYHRVEISSEADAVSVHTQANFAVTFLFITVYSYAHDTREYWKDGCLVGINSTTDDNGDDYFINSSRQQEGLTLVTQDGSNTFDNCIRTFAYWDIELLKSDYLLNTQTGEYQQVTITDMGTGLLDIDQSRVEARQYRLVSEGLTIDLWYTKDMHWLALESKTESGAMLRYLPEKPPQSAPGERS
jgi:hypothetical protein